MISNLLQSVLDLISVHPEILLVIALIWYIKNRIGEFKLPIVFWGLALVFGGGYFLYNLKDVIYFENIKSFDSLFTVYKVIAICIGVVGAGILLLAVVIWSGRHSDKEE